MGPLIVIGGQVIFFTAVREWGDVLILSATRRHDRKPEMFGGVKPPKQCSESTSLTLSRIQVEVQSTIARDTGTASPKLVNQALGLGDDFIGSRQQLKLGAVLGQTSFGVPAIESQTATIVTTV
jgi:hypothetical protein